MYQRQTPRKRHDPGVFLRTCVDVDLIKSKLPKFMHDGRQISVMMALMQLLNCTRQRPWVCALF
jgi:hypothetical protein